MIRQLSAVVLYFALAPVAWGQSLSSPVPSTLVPYTMCTFSDTLAAVSVERIQRRPMFRPVTTASGSKLVSVADAYRVMFAYPNTHYFVNLKIEQSVGGRFSEDKQNIIEEMTEMAVKTPGEMYEQTTNKGVDVYALNRPVIEGGVISMYTLFDDTKGIVVTAYILNADPEHRAFDSMTKYLELRDRFVSAMVSCMAKNRT